jgi:hypothetical protein
MRIIEIINLSLKYNEMLVKYKKGAIWLDNPLVSQHAKNRFLPRWNALLISMDNFLKQFENIGITFEDYESIKCIEIPEQFKRNDIEKYLENFF